MASYNGNERRINAQQGYPCPLHDSFIRGIEKDLVSGAKRMERFESKIDSVLAGLTQQSLEMQTIKLTMGNGLGKDIKETRQCLESVETKLTVVCKTYDEKFIEFDEFRWFRAWANGMKNKTVVWALTFAFLGGAIISVFAMFAYAVFKLLEQFS